LRPVVHRLRTRWIAVVTGLALIGAGVALASVGLASGGDTSPTCLPGERPAGAEICVASDPRAPQIVEAVRDLQEQYALQSVVFGAWRDGTELVSGAVGTAAPGAPATRDVHFWIGNTTEAMTATLLLQLVDRGKLSLDDKLSKWFPDLPHADELTVENLASSTSGYVHYVHVPSFQDAFHADVFRTWTPQELIQIGTSQPLLFPPGTSWSFSDTNFVLLGEILRRVGGEPVSAQLERRILDPLHLRNTRMTTSAEVPNPVLHGYTNERGVWEDATFWTPTWDYHTGNTTSNLSDLGTWGTAVGTGALLSKSSHAAQVAPRTVGLGPLTEKFYYGLGVGVVNKWVLGGAPGLLGYTGIVAYLPDAKTTVVIFTTTGQHSPPGVHYAGAIFNRVGEILAPKQPPNFPIAL
jgi:D-alanyl-D-alanine carboxypeptidase